MAEAAETSQEISPEVRQEAVALGWIPPEEFRGDPEKFIDAPAYVERAKSLMPILRKNNENLRHELGATRTKLAEMEKRQKDWEDSMKAMQEFHAEDTARKVKEAKEAARHELAEARREGDVDREAAAIESIARLEKEGGETKTEKKPPEEKVAERDYTKEPDFVEWQTRNPWIGEDRELSGLCLGIMQDMRMKGEKAVGKEFYDKVDARMSKYLNSGGGAASKVEGARHSGGGGGMPAGKSYSDLPADARAACDKFESRLVGEGRAFKTQAEWRKHYVAEYFKETT